MWIEIRLTKDWYICNCNISGKDDIQCFFIFQKKCMPWKWIFTTLKWFFFLHFRFLHQAMSKADYRNAKGERKEMKLILKTKNNWTERVFIYSLLILLRITLTEKLFWFHLSIFSRKVLWNYCFTFWNNDSSDQFL